MNLKVLVAEDDRKIAAVIKMYLERDGYEVYRAETGREALRLNSTRVWHPISDQSRQ